MLKWIGGLMDEARNAEWGMRSAEWGGRATLFGTAGRSRLVVDHAGEFLHDSGRNGAAPVPILIPVERSLVFAHARIRVLELDRQTCGVGSVFALGENSVGLLR